MYFEERNGSCTFLANLFIELRPRRRVYQMWDCVKAVHRHLECCGYTYIVSAFPLPRKRHSRRTRQMREWRKVLLCTRKHAEHRETRCGVSSHSKDYQRNLSIVISHVTIKLFFSSLTCSNNTCAYVHVCTLYGIYVIYVIHEIHITIHNHVRMYTYVYRTSICCFLTMEFTFTKLQDTCSLRINYKFFKERSPIVRRNVYSILNAHVVVVMY